MIDGLKVTIGAEELQKLCRLRATHHNERATVYAEQIASMKDNQIEGMQYTGGDPIRVLTEKQLQHANENAELTFYAEHLEPDEKYLLSATDLHKLGITSKAY